MEITKGPRGQCVVVVVGVVVDHLSEEAGVQVLVVVTIMEEGSMSVVVGIEAANMVGNFRAMTVVGLEVATEAVLHIVAVVDGASP